MLWLLPALVVSARVCHIFKRYFVPQSALKYINFQQQLFVLKGEVNLDNDVRMVVFVACEESS